MVYMYRFLWVVIWLWLWLDLGTGIDAFSFSLWSSKGSRHSNNVTDSNSTVQITPKNDLHDFFDFLNKISEETFEQYKSNPNKFVCLNPHAFMYGGFGNLILSMVSVQMLSFVLKRPPILNHPLLLSMFEHPDPKQNTCWVLLSYQDINKQKSGITKNICDQMRGSFGMMPPKVGINRCVGSILGKQESKNIFQPFFTQHGLNFSLDHLTTYFTAWTLSRQTPLFQAIVDSHRQKLLSGCKNNATFFDLGIQFRTWRDLNSNDISFDKVDGPCYIDSAKSQIDRLLNKTNRPLCIFVTSDNETSSHIIVQSLNNISDSVIAVSHQSTGGGVNTDWHSGSVIERARNGFDPKELSHHPELLDWMILGETKNALFTAGSTFALTARMRLGLLHDDYENFEGSDFIVHTENKKCVLEVAHKHSDRIRTRRLSIVDTFLEIRQKLHDAVIFDED